MHRSKLPRVRRAALATLAATAAFAAQSQTPTDGQWHGSLVGGGTQSSGNAPSTQLNVAADTVRATGNDKLAFSALSAWGRARIDGRDRKTNDLARAGGRYDRNLNDSLFAFGGGEVESSTVRGLDLRFAFDGGVGFRLVQRESLHFDLLAGGGYSNTDYVDGTSRDGLEFLLGEESAQRFGETSSFQQRFVFFPGTGGMGSRASFDAGLATAIAGPWTLNVGASWRWASKPAPGLRKADTLATVGFGFRY